MRDLGAEFIGTFMLVSAVCGSALFSATFPDVGSGILGVALAVGLTVLVMIYAVGHISGAHFNPAVTCGLWAAGKFPAPKVATYILAQVIGGTVAAGVFFIIAAGQVGFETGGFASNGYGAHSPGGFSLTSVLLIEFVMTALFLIIIVGATSERSAPGFAPIAIGLALTAIHLIAIPVSNASVNPARSLATAFYADGWALQQVWVFWLAPILGGIAGGYISRWLQGSDIN